MIGYRFKKMFFDSPAVMSATDRATRKVLSRFGAFVRQAAKSSIRTRKRISNPGDPPSSHVGTLKRLIYFGYDQSRQSVVIGPVQFNGRADGAEALEYGKIYKSARDRTIRVENGRDARGRFKKWARVQVRAGTTMVYRARPFMRPAFEREQQKLPSLWANSIRP